MQPQPFGWLEVGTGDRAASQLVLVVLSLVTRAGADSPASTNQTNAFREWFASPSCIH